MVPIPDTIGEFRHFAKGHRKLSVRLPMAPLLLMRLSSTWNCIWLLRALICKGLVAFEG